jgi:hypothetical protein
LGHRYALRWGPQALDQRSAIWSNRGGSRWDATSQPFFPHDFKQERAREIQRLIAAVLRRDWDPIGLRDMPDSQDEYERYVRGVYRLLVSEASVRELAEHLAEVEAEALGFADTDPKMLIPVAKKLLKWNVRFEPRGPAANRLRRKAEKQRRLQWASRNNPHEV